MNFTKTLIGMLFLLYSLFHAYSAEKIDSLHRVIKIKTKRDYYVIHTIKNDSLFKIISKKLKVEETGLELLKKGQCYSFVLGTSRVPEKQGPPLDGIVNNLDVKNKRIFIDGKTKIRFTRRFHYRLYKTDNLRGLFYVP